MRIRRRSAAKPITPMPNNASAPGSGTDAATICDAVPSTGRPRYSNDKAGSSGPRLSARI